MTTRLTTRLATRLATRPAVGYTPPGGAPGPGTPVISIVGGGALLPGTTISSDTSLPWLADGVQIAPASLSLELPWTVAPGAVITQPGSNALTVAGYHAAAADFIARRKVRDGGLDMEQTVQWAFDEWFRGQDSVSNLAPMMNDGEASVLLMCGAHTIAGATTPIHPDSPVPGVFNFVSGDYHRVTGLKGDGASKYLDLVVTVQSVPSDDCAIFVDRSSDLGTGCYIGSDNPSITMLLRLHDMLYHRIHGVAKTTDVSFDSGLWCVSRSGSTMSWSTETLTDQASASGTTTSNELVLAFRRTQGHFSPARMHRVGYCRAVDHTALRSGFRLLDSRLQEFLS